MALAAVLPMLSASAGAESPEGGRHLPAAVEPLLAFEDLIRQAIAYRGGDAQSDTRNLLLVETPDVGHERRAGTRLRGHGPQMPAETPLATERVAGVRGTRPSAHEATLARTAFTQRLDLFAERQRFEMAEGSALYGFEGGAALRLWEDLDLTARYRLLDHSSLPDDLDAEFSAPLLGVALRF